MIRGLGVGKLRISLSQLVGSSGFEMPDLSGLGFGV